MVSKNRMRRSYIFYARLAPFEREMVRAAAQTARLKPGTWARRVLLEAALRLTGQAR